MKLLNKGEGNMYKAVVIVLVSWVVVYTMSYGTWLYRNHSRLSGISVYCVSLLAAFLPIYVMFIE